MKKIIIIVVILSTVMFSGCILTQSEDSIVLIEGSYSPPESINLEDTLIWNDTTDGEFVEITVTGEIMNFEIVSIIWNDTTSELDENEVLFHKASLSNQLVVLNTVLPCGIPSRMIKWQNGNGEEYTYLIADYDLVGDEN